jgi:D-glycero-alpha-D-manno-heptose-7-phosphate kinase
MPKVTGIAPTRVDLAGGTLDIRPLSYVLDHCATVNVGISLRARVECVTSDGLYDIYSVDQNQRLHGSYQEIVRGNRLPLVAELLRVLWHEEWPPLRCEFRAESPAGAGLGGSSSLAIAFAASLLRLRRLLFGEPELDEPALVRLVGDVEARLIHCPTGCQDYWGAVRGGLNLIHFPPGDPLVESFRFDELDYLRQRLIVCYSGRSRASGQNNWQIFKSVFDGDRRLLAQLNAIGLLAEQMVDAVHQRQWQTVLELSLEEWRKRCELWPAIESQETQRIAAACQKAGAWFSRVCGAGGGGVMVIFAEPDRYQTVQTAATEAGGQILPAECTNIGLELTESPTSISDDI